MELTDYLRVLRKRWVSIVVLTALALLGAGVATLLATPQYEAKTQLFVSTQGADTAADLQQGNTFTQARVQSYATIVTSDRVLRPAIRALGLDTTPRALAAHVTADAPLNQVLINITVTDASPRQAAAIANAVGRSFITVVDALEKPTDSTASSPVRVSTTEPADVPSAPTSPKVPLNLALGLLVGLAVGVGLAVLRETLDTTVRGDHDLQRLDVPVLAGMPYDAKARTQPLVVQDDPHSVRAENFRQLRTNLQFVTATSGSRSVVITSSVAGEGKSTTAANLAITLASAGTRVALVDADLRRPSIAEYLRIEGGVGLTTVLVGRAGLGDVLQPWGESGNLVVLPAGEIPPNPSELLASDAMGAVLRQLEDDYEVVILDGAPLLPVTDSSILAGVVGGALLVVGSGRTKRPLLERAVASLRQVDARLLGAVVTMVPTKGADAYRTYTYNYAYRSRPRASEAAPAPTTARGAARAAKAELKASKELQDTRPSRGEDSAQEKRTEDAASR